MLLLRLFGKILLLIAFVAFAYDGARVLASPGQGLLLTSISKHMHGRAPGTKEALQQWTVSHAPSYIWSCIVEPLLVLPVSILCAALGALMYLAGYRRPPPEIYDQ